MFLRVYDYQTKQIIYLVKNTWYIAYIFISTKYIIGTQNKSSITIKVIITLQLNLCDDDTVLSTIIYFIFKS